MHSGGSVKPCPVSNSHGEAVVGHDMLPLDVSVWARAEAGFRAWL
jgi:hypothetical protein